MMNQYSHLFCILHSKRVPKSPNPTKTAQILLLVRAPEAEAGNVSLCWRIDRLLGVGDYFLGKCSLIVGDDQFWGISAHFLGVNDHYLG